jgi:hypothetical protein
MQSFNISSASKSSSLKSPAPKDLSNEALIRNTHALVAEERKLTTEILWHMHEIQVRRLYAEKGYASLFEYAVQVLGYSEAAAGRRIAAMRLLVDVPEIEPALQSGEVSLTTLSTIQSFVQRRDRQRKEEPVSKMKKKELVLALQGKSRRECEKHLIALDPSAATPRERERVISPTQTEIRFIADDELMDKFQKIKELDGHVQSNPTYLEFFHRIADLVIQELDPLAQKKSVSKRQVKPAIPPAELKTQTSTPEAGPEAEKQDASSLGSVSHSRYIPAALKREIWSRDQSQCLYQSTEGKRCGSRFALEIDHIIPIALGGKSELSNLQLLCREHNRQKAVLQLGPSVMQLYLR